ncbi:MAG TPA: hypothetical protein VHF06_10575 [Pseudonocardiaceae bacterium]|jgi:hypothetical protein|nr:hypothetical protein [Pseudonocardiaceae bacterium]
MTVLPSAIASVARRIRLAVRRESVVPQALPSSPGDVERMVTARLLAGQLDRTLYQDCMAAIAATVSRTEHDIDW